MSIIHIIAVFVLTIFFANNALAETQSPFQGGLKYTAIRKAENAAPAQPTELDADNQDEDSAAARVWRKYQDLATGQAADTENDTGKETPEATVNTDVEPAPQNAGNTGLSGLMQQYQHNKQSRSEMHTIKIKQPEPVAPPSVPDVNAN
ncbi:MAG: hypothetical protein KDJ35_07240 [Alphaproteobacteria bacterium]|nr:hypothetical protein [Alphaproteobacteria bacterium]